MRIALIGASEKNLIVLPLLKVLSTKGDTLYITKDKTLYRDTDTPYFENTNIIITNESYEEVWDSVELKESQFEYIVYNMVDELPFPMDKYIQVKWDFEEGYEDADLVEEDKLVTINLKGKLTPSSSEIESLAKTRITGTYQISKNKTLLKELCKPLAEVLDMQPGEVFKRIISE